MGGTAKAECLAQGCAKKASHPEKKSAAETASVVGTSARKVEQARTVMDKATPEVIEAAALTRGCTTAKATR